MFIMYSFGFKISEKAILRRKISLYSQINKCYDALYQADFLHIGFVLMAIFFVILLWISIVILTLLTLHEVLKKYIIWVVEEYLAKRETLAPAPKKKKK